MKYVVNGKEFDNLEEAQKFEAEINAKNNTDVMNRVKEIDNEVMKLQEEYSDCHKRLNEIIKTIDKLVDERLELAGPADAFDLMIKMIKAEL